jgi:hypothetical protein
MITRVWRGTNYYNVIVAAYAAACRAKKVKCVLTPVWGDEQDKIIKDNYYRHSTAQIARMLREKFQRKYTKNMVISRYHRIKGTHDV